MIFIFILTGQVGLCILQIVINNGLRDARLFRPALQRDSDSPTDNGHPEEQHMCLSELRKGQDATVTHIPEVDRHHRGILKGLRDSFRMVSTAYKYIHSFDAVWSITLASDHPYDIRAMEPDVELHDLGISDLRYYTGRSHRAAFLSTLK